MKVCLQPLLKIVAVLISHSEQFGFTQMAFEPMLCMANDVPFCTVHNAADNAASLSLQPTLVSEIRR